MDSGDPEDPLPTGLMIERQTHRRARLEPGELAVG